MRRHPNDIVQIGLRLRESLRRKLEREADNHRISLNAEIVLRLQDSFEERDARRSLHSIVTQMDRAWSQYEHYLAASRLEDELFEALMEERVPEEIIKLLEEWLRQRRLTRRIVEANKIAKAAVIDEAYGDDS
jgi:hypothetical protein